MDLNYSIKQNPASWNTMFGYKVITDPNMTGPGEPYEANRTWIERLFTRPWRPFKTTKTIIPQVPIQEIYFKAHNMTAIMHPDWAEKLRKELPSMN